MSLKKILPSIVLFFLYLHPGAQTFVLPRSAPEAEGVSSKRIIEFLDTITRSRHELHSLMIIRHGKVIAEGWNSPYRADLKHTMYSVSKSFTSTAIGFAVSEKRLTVNDKVISFFPDQLPEKVTDHLSDMTIKDLLAMSAGQSPDPTATVCSKDSNWVKAFLALPVLNDPGTSFLYNSLATYMLSAIIQKVSGQKLIDYLTPRLFKPLGIQGMDWETDPMGVNTGGWGLRIKTEDMARFGLLYLQKGKWNGQQILPEAWVEEATSFKIDQAPNAQKEQREKNDWIQGYCYQFWRSRHNSYRGDGAFGQYILVLPEQDAVIAITSETTDMQGELNLVWQYLLPALKAERSTLNFGDTAILKMRLTSLRIPVPVKTDSVFKVVSVPGKKYVMESNAKNITNMSFAKKKDVVTLTLKTPANTHVLNFGDGKWIEGKTSFPGPSLVEDAKGHDASLPPSQVAGSYRWKQVGVLELYLRYIDSPHTQKITFYFSPNKITVDMQDSFKTPDKKITLKGDVQK